MPFRKNTWLAAIGVLVVTSVSILVASQILGLARPPMRYHTVTSSVGKPRLVPAAQRALVFTQVCRKLSV